MSETTHGLSSVMHLGIDALVRLIDIASRRDLEPIIALRRQRAWRPQSTYPICAVSHGSGFTWLVWRIWLRRMAAV